MAMVDSDSAFGAQVGDLVLQSDHAEQHLPKQTSMANEHFPHEDGQSGPWDAYGHMSDLWPSSFGRVFGYSMTRDVNNPGNEIQ